MRRVWLSFSASWLLFVSSILRGACYFFFNDTATTEIYTLSLHDALPICGVHRAGGAQCSRKYTNRQRKPDRKSTRLNSSHGSISYAVFCLKKKTRQSATTMQRSTPCPARSVRACPNSR